MTIDGDIDILLSSLPALQETDSLTNPTELLQRNPRRAGDHTSRVLSKSTPISNCETAQQASKCLWKIVRCCVN